LSRSESDPLEPSQCVSKGVPLCFLRTETLSEAVATPVSDERKRSSLALVPRIVLVVVLVLVF
jgi:hypothetical protein